MTTPSEEQIKSGQAQDIQPTTEQSSNGVNTEPKADEKVQEPSLEVQLTEAKAKAAEYLDGWQRARAEFANYKKRADKEREEIQRNTAVETFSRLLPVIDDLDRAITNIPTGKADDEIAKGLNLIHRKFLSLLDNAGVKVINPIGEPFNAAFHEALGQDESDTVASGHITTVSQKGYMYGDRVLRPALVRVAR